MFGNDIPLEINSSGHYYMIIKPSKLPHKDLEMILISDIINKKTTESPWTNGHVERHNGILGFVVSKVIEDSSCSLETALA